MNLVRIAFKSVARKFFRNTVLICAVALLVSLLFFALSFERSITEQVEATLRKLGADIVLVPPEAKELAEDFILESKEKRFYMPETVFAHAASLPGVERATYQIYLDTLESGCCSIVEGQVVVFDQKSDFVVSSWLAEDALRPLKKGEVYVGNYVWEYLGLMYTTKLFGEKMKVAGHLEKTGTGLDHGIFLRLEDLQRTNDAVAGQFEEGNISIVFLKLAPGAKPDAVEREIVEVEPGVGIMTRANIGGDIKAVLADIMHIFSITIVISSLLAMLLAWSVFTAMANERVHEVGLMRALGATRRHIVAMFLMEAGLTGVAGGFAGIAVGHLLVAYLARNFHLVTRLGGISPAAEFSAILGLVSIAAGIVVCLVGALIPILAIARMEPLQAIKQQ